MGDLSAGAVGVVEAAGAPAGALVLLQLHSATHLHTHCILYTVYCILYTLHCIPCTGNGPTQHYLRNEKILRKMYMAAEIRLKLFVSVFISDSS